MSKMDFSTNATTKLLLMIFTLTLSSLLSISTSQDLAPSPSSSSNVDSSTSPSPSSSSESAPTQASPTMSPADALMQDKELADISSPSGSVSGDLTTDTTTNSLSPASVEVTTADPPVSFDDASSSYESHAAPSPSPDASYPSFPTMFSTKFERKMQESSMTKPTDLVRELCSGAENPGKCMEFFRESRSDDPAEIINTEIGTLKALVHEGISAATKVRRQDNTGGGAASAVLDVCLENYDKAMANLDKASATCAKCIRSNPKCSPKNTGEVKTMLSAVISNVGFCDEAFNAQGIAPPMKATNEAVIELTDWLLEFCKKLGKKY